MSNYIDKSLSIANPNPHNLGLTERLAILTGLVGLVSFLFIIYAVVYEEGVLHNELFVHLMGMVEGVVISNIFAYYYGSSAEK